MAESETDPERYCVAMNRRESNGHNPTAVVVAVEPRVYADIIGAALAELRPGFDVKVVEPDEIYCRARNPDAETTAAEIRVNGVVIEKRNPTLDDLLEILDRADLPERV